MSENNSCAYCKKIFSTKGNCTRHLKICNIKKIQQEYEKNKILELNNLIEEKEEHIEFLKDIIKHFVKSRSDKLNDINNLNI